MTTPSAPAPSPRPPYIVRISFPGVTLPGGPRLGDMGAIVVCDPLGDPPRDLRGWVISLRGGSVFLSTPPGWLHGRDEHAMRKAAEAGEGRTVFEVPRQLAIVRWSTDDLSALDKVISRYDSAPIGRPKADP